MENTYEYASQTTKAIYHAIVEVGAEPEALLKTADLTIEQVEFDDYDKHIALWQAGEALLNSPTSLSLLAQRIAPSTEVSLEGCLSLVKHYWTQYRQLLSSCTS
jgi:hypothetical protein